MSVLAVLPVVTFLFLFIFFIKLFAELRRSFLWAAVVWTLFTVTLTEILSIFHVLTQAGVAAGWAFMALLVLAGVIVSKKNPQDYRPKIQGLCLIEIMLLALTAGIIFGVGLNAFFAAPNNWDSMTYHLPRVLHWIQNRSVEHYATAILRQLYQPPGAEFLILQFQILTGNDRFANLVQWFSMIGSALVLSLIAADLGAGRKGQILTAFLVVTIPMGILQGSSTQNDYVAGFWLAVLVFFGLRLLSFDGQGRQRGFDIAGAGLALGFTLLTKGTGYIFAAPWIAAFVLFGLLKKRKMFLRDLVVIALICFVFNAAFYTRNMKLFGSPISAGTEDYTNKGNLIGNGIANVVRNVALHMGTPFAGFNKALKDNIIKLSGQDESNSWGDFDIPTPSTSEDIAGNPLHLLLILIIFVAVLISRKSPQLRNYTLLIIAGFILFCVYLKWQLFHSRLHLPLFLLSMPVVAVVLERLTAKFWIPLIALFLLAGSLPPLLYNERHPLVGKKNVFNMSRMEQYFSYRKFMAVPYVLSAKYAASRLGSDVGLLLGGDDWEYPLWILLKKEKPDVRIYHSGVKNVSGALAQDKKVTVIISELADPPNVVSFEQKVFLKRQQFSFMSIYENPRF